MNVGLLLAVWTATSIILIVWGLNRVLSAGADVQDRLQMYGVAPTIRERPRREQQRATDTRRRQGSFGASLSRDLARADLRLTVTEFVAIQALLMIVGAVLGIAAGNPGLSLLAAVIGFALPRFYLARRQQGRLNAFNGQLGDTLMLMANALRSGYSLLQSMETVSRESPAPTSQEFGRVVREVSLGLTPEEALANLVRRISSEDLELMVTAVNVQHEVGGNLAQILDTISWTIRERVRIKGEINSLTAQQRLSGYVISALPVVVGVGMFLLNPTYVSQLFSFQTVICMPLIGLPIIASVMVIVGFFVIRRIVAIDV